MLNFAEPTFTTKADEVAQLLIIAESCGMERNKLLFLQIMANVYDGVCPNCKRSKTIDEQFKPSCGVNCSCKNETIDMNEFMNKFSAAMESLVESKPTGVVE